MRWNAARRSGRTFGLVVVGALSIMATTLATGVPTAGAAVSATTPWALMKTPYLFGSHTYDFLNGVSCPTTTFCISVGSTATLAPAATPDKALAEDWTGGKTSSWKVVSTTGLPLGSTTLQGVSCSSPTYCMATGVGNGTSFAALWNGSTWSTTLSFMPSQARWKVSCFLTDCMAVGSVFGSTDTMTAEYWDGQTWTNSVLTGSPGALYDVSCFSATQCFAVGESSSADPLGEYFNNGAWSGESPSNPVQFSGFTGVDCERAIAPTTCMAVGSNVSGVTPSPIAEVWNALTGSWTVTSTTQTEGFDAVSCPTTTWCVGTAEGGIPPAAQAWDGSRWTVMNTKAATSVSGPARPFNAVSCPSATFCVAVGDRKAFVGQQPEIASWGTVP